MLNRAGKTDAVTSVHFEIDHDATIEFAEGAQAAAFPFRLRPRSDARQSVELFEIFIVPKPDMLVHTVDAEGNIALIAAIPACARRIRVSARSRIETRDVEPFVHRFESVRQSLPFTYPESLRWLLAHARHRSIRRSDDDPVRDFADRLRRMSENTGGFLDRLAATICNQFDHAPDSCPSGKSPADVLRYRRGTSGELAELFIESCRAMGIAARFVSGYHAGHFDQVRTADKLEPGLHAWSEIFLPGTGWIGYDPTLGGSVGERHIAVAAAADPINAAICGSIDDRAAKIVQLSARIIERATGEKPLVAAKRRRA